jgi:hypothetical protein
MKEYVNDEMKKMEKLYRIVKKKNEEKKKKDGKKKDKGSE